MGRWVTCANCGWEGGVERYDIGDGPEWCCPACDTCWPSNPVVGEDGLTGAERNLERAANEAARQHGFPEIRLPRRNQS